MSNIFPPHLTHSKQSAHAGKKSIFEASKIPGAREKCVFGRGKLEIGQIRSTQLRSGIEPGETMQLFTDGIASLAFCHIFTS